MYKEILKVLKCPKCNGELSLTVNKEENDEIIDGKLSCGHDHHWAIREGVINFGSSEQEFGNSWTEFYKEHDYEELDKKILEGIPANIRILNEKTKKFIIDSVNDENNAEFILDVATGRGMLFTDMVKQLKVDAQIICADLSFEVLRYDRLKAKKINPDIKVNYIACDATDLPFKDSSIDCAVSFAGIANMADKTADGIKEAKRVLKTGKSLLNSSFIIKEDSEGYRACKKFCHENNIKGAEEFMLKTRLERAHNEAGFEKVNLRTIGEDIGQKCEFDLIPYEGEWFAVVVAECKK